MERQKKKNVSKLVVLMVTSLILLFGKTAYAQTDVLLNYLYVENQVLGSGDTQNVVVSVTDEAIENVSVIVTTPSGQEESWEQTKQEKEIFQFQKTVTEEGTYQMTGLQFDKDGQEIKLDFKELEIFAEFTVGPKTEEIACVDDKKAQSEEIVEQAVNNAMAQVPAVYDLGKSGKPIVIVIDPGHDGISSGAQGNGLGEEDIVLSISKYCKAALEEYSDVEVYLTRYGDECPAGFASYNHNEGACLRRRVEIAVEKNADLFLSFHINSSTASSAKGVEVYYPNNNYRPDLGEEGKKVATEIQKELVDLGMVDRGIHTWNSDYVYPDGSTADYLAVIRESKKAGIPGVLVEHGFISNAGEVATYLRTEESRKALGEADARGIAKALGLEKGKWEYKDGHWYWLKPDGSYEKNGWKWIAGKCYYFYEDGHMAADETTPDGYYVNKSGVWSEDRWEHNEWGWWYSLKEGGYPKATFKEINGQTYYFDEYGYIAIGWKYIDGKWYHFSESGYMQKGGWLNLDGKSYYLYEDGRMAANEMTPDGYYVNSSGAWAEDRWEHNQWGWWYSLKEGGYPKATFKEIDDQIYYFDEYGYISIGWKFIDGKWYHFSESGYMQKGGWLNLDGKSYYLYEDGHMAADEMTPDGYYVNSSGAWAVDHWEKNQWGWWYSLKEGGYPKETFKEINGQTYYFDEHGYIEIGWKLVEGKWYHFKENGYMEKDGWIKLNGVSYYLYEDGHMASNETTPDGFYVNSSGAWTIDHWEQNQWGWWYSLKEGGYPKSEFKDISGKTYYFDEYGYIVTGWKFIDGKWYYFYESGAMAKDGKTPDGYQVDSDGVLIAA